MAAFVECGSVSALCRACRLSLPVLNSDNPVLRARALLDLTRRARNAIPIYSIVWLSLSLWADLPKRAPVVFFSNLLVLLAIALLRAWHYRLVTHGRGDSVKQSRWLVRLLLISALHWGALSAWMIHDPQFIDLRSAFMIMLAAFAMGGTPILGISTVVRTWYPIFILLPSMFGTLFSDHADQPVMNFLIVISLLYINMTSRMTGEDYERATTNQYLAEQRADQLDAQRTLDGLTGLRNRRFFDERFELDWATCQRNSLPLTILMIDLDHFKAVNDNYGHLCGDQCLIEVADSLRKRVSRSTDTIARFGGEEFVALLPATDGRSAKVLAQRIVDDVARLSVICDGIQLNISCSIGLACKVPGRDDRREELLHRADTALYAAKEQGRNRVFTATNG